MKTKIYMGLWAVFAVSCLSGQATDNPAQAAARIILEQKLKELDTPQAQTTPGTVSHALVIPSDNSVTNTNTIVTIPAKAVATQTAPPMRTPVAPVVVATPTVTVAPVKPKPVPVPEAKPAQTDWAAAPAVVTPAAAIAPVQSRPAVVLQSTPSATEPAAAVVPSHAVPIAPVTIQPAAAVATSKPAPVIIAKKSPTSPLIIKSTNEIVSIYGTVYKNAHVEKVEADGLIISHLTSGGGLAISKVYFTDLPYKIREQYERNKRP